MQGHKYWQPFVDDSSRFLVIAFISQKSEALVAFKHYCKGITQTLIPNTLAVKPKASQSTDGNLLWSVVYISDTACLRAGAADDTQPALADPHPLRRRPVTGRYAPDSYKAYAEKALGKHILLSRDDKGGEFISREFDDSCADEGILHQHTEPNEPYQNGVAEHVNKDIAAGATALLVHVRATLTV
jgi:hypothetical protein